MDPITHAALGAASAQAVLGKYNKSIPWKVGALASMAPDLDIFIPCTNNILCLELWHRSFTHSLVFIPFGGLIVGLIFLLIPHFRAFWKITLSAALIGYASHGLLDALTSYGTCLFWPFSNQRISWDDIAIVDPIFTFTLLLGVSWSLIHKDTKGAKLGLLCAGFFLLFNGIQHGRAIQSIHQFAKQKELNFTKIRAIPYLASSTYWRGIAKNGDCLLISEVHTPLFQKSTIVPLIQAPLLTKTLNLSLEKQQELAVFSWFNDDYTLIAKYNPFIVADGRYTMGNKSVYSLWGLNFSSDKGPTERFKFILLEESCRI